MSAADQHQTSPEDRVPFLQKIAYGAGAFANNTLAASIGGMMIVLNVGLGMNPALVGLLGMIPRLFDAITDPIIGFVSDNTRSRWGRRRPYIFVGAIAVAIAFAMLWQLPEAKSEMYYFWYFLVGSLIFFLAYTIFVTPWVALGYELTADYHERTRLMGIQNAFGNIPYLIAPYYLAIMQNERFFDDMMDGAAGLSIVIAVVVLVMGITPAIFLRERFSAAAEDGSDQLVKTLGSQIKEFFKGFVITMSFRPFLKLAVATFLVFNGFQMVAAFQFYVIAYYVFGGDLKLGATFAGHAGTLGALSGLGIILLITYFGSKYGKRHVFYVTTGLSIVGYLLKWFCYNPELPWLVLLPAPLIACGYAGLFTLMPSMIADVVDADELNTNERREGMYGSIFWWVVKLGLSAALLMGGLLLNATGFDVALEGAQTERTLFLLRVFDVLVPAIASAIAIWMIATYSITEERAHEVRAELEARRGVL